MRVMGYAKFLVFSLVCLASALPQSQDPPVEQITSALRVHDFDHAIALTRAALKRTPNNAIQMANTTKSGSDQFHGLASDYFNYQKMYAKTEFMKAADDYHPFHSNNFSGAIGGPIIPHHQFFFFFAAEPVKIEIWVVK
jgi:hypothetical protein